MRLKFVPLTCLALALLASPVLAKEKKHAKQMDPQAMMEMYQKLATPGEPHKQLASLAGSWITKTKEWMEPGKPPTEAAGSAEIIRSTVSRIRSTDCAACSRPSTDNTPRI